MAQCITANHKGIARVIRGPAVVRAAYDPNLDVSKHPPPHKVFAIWDTGATGSVITQAVVDQCSLKQIGLKKVCGVHSEEISPVFLVNIELPNVGFPNIAVTLGRLPAGTDVLIGMDIISRGDFAITNHAGNTVFTFRTPSCGKIDFVADAKSGHTPVKLAPVVGRNSRCPCGSGRKFKNCCGKGAH
jgi:hypothetical protein